MPATLVKPAVFFDGSCPMCSQEIAFYQRQRGAEAIEWVDVSACPSSEVPSGLSREEVMARFHVVGADGRIVSGAYAFAKLWQILPRFAVAGRIMAMPGIRHMLEVGYVAFLPLRPWLQRRFRARTRLPH